MVKVGQIYEWTQLNIRFIIYNVKYIKITLDRHAIRIPRTITCIGNNGYNYIFTSDLIKDWWFIKEYPTWQEAINDELFASKN